MIKILSIGKTRPRYDGFVELESPVFAEDEARNAEFGQLPAPVASPRLPYDIEALTRTEVDEQGPRKKLDYDISALPGRQRFHITSNGQEVTPATGTQAAGYYGVDMKMAPI